MQKCLMHAIDLNEKKKKALIPTVLKQNKTKNSTYLTAPHLKIILGLFLNTEKCQESK